jgi:hypothetical protein
MSQPETRLSRRDAERLLDAPASHDSALGWALSAANAPAHPGELRREDAAVAAFHTARLTPSPTSRSNYVSPTKLGSRAAARAVIATAAVVALTSGGFALANSAHLPLLPDQASDQATESVAKTPKPTETTTETTESTEAAETETPTESTTESATPTPSFEGLCKAYQATDRSDHGKSLDSAAFTALATEAGAAGVEAYCVALIGEPTAKPTTGRPTDKPTPGKPSDQPTGKPSVLPTPTDKPTDKPSPGKPTDAPGSTGKVGGKDSSTSGS